MGALLDKAAKFLKQRENNIIVFLLLRAQEPGNKTSYQRGKSGFANYDGSYFDHWLNEIEIAGSKSNRYSFPGETSFFKNLPEPELELVRPDTGLFEVALPDVDIAKEIREAYLSLIPKLCDSRDDRNTYGSSAEMDVLAFQALSLRIHYGALYVAEAKFQENEEKYTSLIRAGDVNGIETALTRPKVEEEIRDRIQKKVSGLQTIMDLKIKVDPQLIMDFYDNTIIPLTKKGQVDYLMKRIN
tara:strand:- start:1081 stop:1809 length:729 start_codon:yes stop_codon:yes gene_type:complete